MSEFAIIDKLNNEESLKLFEIEFIHKCIKLQKLVKEEIKENYTGFADIQRLEEMVEESKHESN